MFLRDYLIKTLDYVHALARRKLVNNECTKDEMDSFSNILNNQLTMYVTTKEAAEIFGKEEKLIHSVIERHHRKGFLQRIRSSRFNFMQFISVMPKGWKPRK